MIQLDLKDILWCWETDYYDGRLAAIAFYKDGPVYVRCVVDEDDTDQRIFAVYQLEYWSFVQLYYRNLLWEKYVGIHDRLDTDGKRPFLGQVKPESSWKNYPWWKESYKYDKSNLIGYITLDGSPIDWERIK